MSTNNKWLRFFDIRVLSFAGIYKGKKAEIIYPEGFTPKDQINPENGIVIFFPEEHRYVEASGDQGAGKSSWLNLIKEFCGHIALDKFINRTDNDKKYEGFIEGVDGETYKVRATKTEFNLWQVVKDEQGNILRERAEKKAKETIKRLVGPAGISPLDIATMKPEKQIEWIRTVVKLSEEQQALENSLTTEIDETYEARKKANAKTKEKETLLKTNQFYADYEGWKKYFTNTSFDTLEEEIKDVRSRHTTYQEKQRELFRLSEKKTTVENNIADYERQIRELQIKLEGCRTEWQTVTTGIADAEQYLEQNQSVVQEYAAADNKVREASEFGSKKTSFEAMETVLNEYNHFSSESIRLTSRLDSLREKKKEFNQLVAPPVEGLEVCLPDEEDKRHGLYYRGMPLELLCESDNWEWYTDLSRACGFKVMYIENITSLGSGSLQKFNEFIEQGGYVFATKMQHGDDTLRITFNKKIPF